MNFITKKDTKQYILSYTHSHGAAPVLLNVHWLEHEGGQKMQDLKMGNQKKMKDMKMQDLKMTCF